MRMPASYDDLFLMVPGGRGIYVPAEDTYLLLDLVASFLKEDLCRSEYVSCPALDMGSGSGIVGLYLSKFFTEVHGVDVNMDALAFQVQERRLRQGRGSFLPVNASLLSFLRASGTGLKYHLACFNPPYLPEDDDEEPAGERGQDMAGKALFSPGGGVAILEEFLFAVKEHLDPRGHVFYITSSLMDMPDHDAWIAGLGYRQVGETRGHLFFEDIVARHVVKL